MTRRSLTPNQRDELYKRCKGDDEFPSCNLCLQPIRGQRWHESHNPYLPLALGGMSDGIAHEKCNLKHAREHDVPLIAKNNRISKKWRDLRRTRRPMPFGRDHDLKQKIGGGVVERATNRPRPRRPWVRPINTATPVRNPRVR